MVTDGLLAFAIPASDNRPDPTGRIAKQRCDLIWCVALLHQPQDVPMGSLHRITCLAVAFMQLCCSYLSRHDNSFCHDLSIHYLNGFDMTGPQGRMTGAEDPRLP